jgi:hypothetical protein
LQRIGFGDGAFDPRDVDPTLLLVNIVALEQRHFRGPYTMVLGQLQEGAVTFAREDRQEPTHLILRKEGELG